LTTREIASYSLAPYCCKIWLIVPPESASADVVLQNYLPDTRARKLQREYMRDQLAEAFE
jgi:hypothetical protein